MKNNPLLLTSPINRRYVTGLHTSAGIVLVLPDITYFLTDSRYSEMAKQACPQDIQVIEITREKSYKEWLPELLTDVQTLGYEADKMPVERYEHWKKLLPCELVAAQSVVHNARQVKSAGEIANITESLRIAEASFTETLPMLKDRPTEREVAVELTCHMLRNGAEKPAFGIIVAAGENGSKPHAEPTDRVVQDGDFVTIDMGCVVNGYHSDFTRTVAVGHVTDKMREVYDVVLQAQLAGINAVRAGVAGGEIDLAARQVIVDAGYGDFFGHGFGHGIGLEIHEGVSAGVDVKHPLPAGSILTAEPGIYLPGKFGVRIEDLLVVTESGHENLSNLSKELIIL